jgi:hypothetical protein
MLFLRLRIYGMRKTHTIPMLIPSPFTTALASITLAHGGVTSYTIDGTTYPWYLPPPKKRTSRTTQPSSYKWVLPLAGQDNLIQRTPHQNPHTNATSPNMTCNYHGVSVTRAFHDPVTGGATISAT